MRTTARFVALGVLGLLAAGCQPKASQSARPAPAPLPAPVAAPPMAAAPAAAPIAPEVALQVTQSLAASQAFNLHGAEDIAAVTKADKRIDELARQAADAAAKSSSASEADRAALAKRVSAARAEVEAAHNDLASRQASFRVGAQGQVDATAAAQLQCAKSAEFAASQPCVDLLAEQQKLDVTVKTLTAKFAAAEATYLKSRPRLEESSAIMALGAR